jgi:hypothetical protein
MRRGDHPKAARRDRDLPRVPDYQQGNRAHANSYRRQLHLQGAQLEHLQGAQLAPLFSFRVGRQAIFLPLLSHVTQSLSIPGRSQIAGCRQDLQSYPWFSDYRRVR